MQNKVFWVLTLKWDFYKARLNQLIIDYFISILCSYHVTECYRLNISFCVDTYSGAFSASFCLWVACMLIVLMKVTSQKQLESFSVFPTLPVRKWPPGVFLTRTSINTICCPPTPSHLSQACRCENSIPELTGVQIWERHCLNTIQWDRTILAHISLEKTDPHLCFYDEINFWYF